MISDVDPFTPASMPRRQHAARVMETVAVIATIATVPALMHARALADGSICTVDLLFLARCAVQRDWRGPDGPG